MTLWRDRTIRKVYMYIISIIIITFLISFFLLFFCYLFRVLLSSL